MRSIQLLTWFASISIATGACKTSQMNKQSDVNLYSGEGRAYSIKKAITVCFAQTSKSTGLQDIDALNDVFRKAVEEEWGAKTGVKTAGWKPCSEMPTAMVKLNFFDCPGNGPQCPDGNASPHVAFIGPPPTDEQNVVNLRHTYEGHWRSKSCNGRQGFLGFGKISELEARSECTRNYGIHEFGHILGFSHEHSSPKAPKPQACENDNEPDHTMIGKGAAKWTCSSEYDEDSVMNYCAKEGWFNWNLGLSEKDVSCAKEFFARQQS